MASANFRANVGIVVAGPDGRVAWFERADSTGSYQFPQGGIDRHESAREAAERELREETNLRARDVQWVAERDDWLVYEFPTAMVTGKRRGQAQRWFLVRLPEGTEPDLQAAHDAEFRSWRWGAPDELVETVIDFKRSVYATVARWAADVLASEGHAG